MLGPVNRLMAGYGATDPTGDWTARLLANQGGHPNIDLGMAAQPPVDPGYAMPNVAPENLPQMPGQEVGGWLPVNATQGMDPTDPRYPAWLQMMRQYGAIR